MFLKKIIQWEQQIAILKGDFLITEEACKFSHGLTFKIVILQGGAPVWFHRSHICNAPRLFEILFGMFKVFLSEQAKNGITLHKRSTGWEFLHEEVGSADILPEEFGGTAGSMNNLPYLDALLDSSDYFETLRKCSQKSSS